MASTTSIICGVLKTMQLHIEWHDVLHYRWPMPIICYFRDWTLLLIRSCISSHAGNKPNTIVKSVKTTKTTNLQFSSVHKCVK